MKITLLEVELWAEKIGDFSAVPIDFENTIECQFVKKMFGSTKE